MASKLNSGQEILSGGTLASPDGNFQLFLQLDGNMVLYGPGGEALWSAEGTWGKNTARAVMQDDGNFVVYNTDWKPIWSSGTYNHPGAWLTLENDGTISIFDAEGKRLWQKPDPHLDTKTLVEQLIKLKAADPDKKIAFVFSGGGARAAWFGGMLEAIEQEIRRQQPSVVANRRLAPDIIAATSGGGMAAVGYLADLINPGTSYGPYVNRQSWLWREISRRNRAAFDLFENPGMVELFSGSRSSTGLIDWETIKDKPLQEKFKLANINYDESPTYRLNALLASIKEIKEQSKLVEAKWQELRSALDQFDIRSQQLFAIIPQSISEGWISTIQYVKNEINILKNQINTIMNDVGYIRDRLTKIPPRVGQALSRAKGLVSEGAKLLLDAHGRVHALVSHIANIPINTLQQQFPIIKKLLKDDIPGIVNALQSLHHNLSGEITQIIKAIIKSHAAVFEATALFTTTGLIARNHSSLMFPGGLRNAVHETLRVGAPVRLPQNVSAATLDMLLFMHWQNLRDLKKANPLIRAPELFLTASNLSAQRLVLLSICDEETFAKMAEAGRWLIRLGVGGIGRMVQRRVDPANLYDRKNWMFEAKENQIYGEKLKELDMIRNWLSGDSKGPKLPNIAIRTRGDAYNPPAGCPYDQKPGSSRIDGESVIAKAAITTSTIPLAFPPIKWTYQRPSFLAGKENEFSHWFVDGGMCDNRPIEQALAAGADYIISFELNPLRKAAQDIPLNPPKPNIFGVAASSMMETPINSAFNRFLEKYVYDNRLKPGEAPTKRIWRISPEVGLGAEDEAIGPLDFNGYWSKGELKMGLFDWFMCGYLDGNGFSKADPMVGAYLQAKEYEQKGDAAQKRRSKGFYKVDFLNLRPHPLE